jgi:hypothetical protein
MAILIGIIGGLLTVFGAFAFFGSFMPSFGGARNGDAAARALGIFAFVAGIAVIFYAGTWA